MVNVKFSGLHKSKLYSETFFLHDVQNVRKNKIVHKPKPCPLFYNTHVFRLIKYIPLKSSCVAARNDKNNETVNEIHAFGGSYLEYVEGFHLEHGYILQIRQRVINILNETSIT